MRVGAGPASEGHARLNELAVSLLKPKLRIMKFPAVCTPHCLELDTSAHEILKHDALGRGRGDRANAFERLDGLCWGGALAFPEPAAG